MKVGKNFKPKVKQVANVSVGSTTTTASAESVTFKELVKSLCSGKDGWWNPCMIASRRERKRDVEKAVRFRVNPWSKREVGKYVEKFFEGGGEERGDEEKKVRKLLCLDEGKEGNEKLVEFAGIPLICELVCTVGGELREEDGLLEVFRKVVELIWSRSEWVKERNEVGDEERRKLQQKAVEAFKKKMREK